MATSCGFARASTGRVWLGILAIRKPRLLPSLPPSNCTVGFDGTETSRSQRAGRFRQTILDGALGFDQRAYHVVTCLGPFQGSVRIDGFAIRGGYADGRGPSNFRSSKGGGIYAESCYLEVDNCLFAQNFAQFGGGLYFQGDPGDPGVNGVFARSIVGVSRSEFVLNYALVAGGGINFKWAGDLVSNSVMLRRSYVMNCAFRSNSAGLRTEEVLRNQAGGGAIHLGNAPYPTAVDAYPGDPVQIANCLFHGNRVRGAGAAILVGRDLSGLMTSGVSNVHIDHCTFTRNTATQGRTIPFNNGPFLNFPGSTIYAEQPMFSNGQWVSTQGHVRNSILWDNPIGAATFMVNIGHYDPPGTGNTPPEGTPLTVEHSLVETRNFGGGLGPRHPGQGNVNGEPMFTNPAVGNYQLLSGSRCVDRGTTGTSASPDSYRLQDWADLDGDGDYTELAWYEYYTFFPRDVDLPPTPNCPGSGVLVCGTVDMGAHERQRP